MEVMYFVEYTVHNKTTGAWAHNTSGSNSNLTEAKRLWGSEINRLYGSADFDFVSVTIIDNYGNKIMSDAKDVRPAPEPQPEPQPEPTEE